MAPPELPAQALLALERGQLIEAIKLTREQTGLGLKESKQAVEVYLARHPALLERSHARAGSNAGLGAIALLAAALVLAYLLLAS